MTDYVLVHDVNIVLAGASYEVSQLEVNYCRLHPGGIVVKGVELRTPIETCALAIQLSCFTQWLQVLPVLVVREALLPVAFASKVEPVPLNALNVATVPCLASVGVTQAPLFPCRHKVDSAAVNG
eukprot:scaffold5678_cov394-Prasinococcus_capsulatus_cf.AAC.2